MDRYKDSTEIYIHIPFCKQKCSYCDFLSFPAEEETKEEYVRALIQQIKTDDFNEKGDCLSKPENHRENRQNCIDRTKNEENEHKVIRSYGQKVCSIYFGGGTPGLLEAGQLEEIQSAVLDRFDADSDCEITIEVNPGITDLCKLKALKEAGFNRLSIGMQSSDDDELKMLGRIHSYNDFLRCYEDARQAGFSNINIDVMTALPGQTEEKLLGTLDKVISLKPEHISAYSLIIEEGTPFYNIYGSIEGPVVGQELERGLYWMCVSHLKEAGYEHYEISNFARKGYESRHNCGYWMRRQYYGFGLGASSLVYPSGNGGGTDSIRLVNTASMNEYLKDPVKKGSAESISRREAMDEYMFLGLRMANGVDADDFRRSFGEDMTEIYSKPIEKSAKEGLLLQKGNVICLTPKGVDYGNYVFSQFLSD